LLDNALPYWEEEGITVKYKVALRHSEEGVRISVPGLPGCWSQGSNEQEAIENIRIAIQEYLSVAEELSKGWDIREIEVAV
jgi:predicted RNase H-like HicB family nuclease